MVMIDAIKEKGEELEIPFGNLAAAFVVEKFLIRLSESGMAERFWLKNPENIGLEFYKRRLINGISFFYCSTGDKSFRMQIEEIAETLFAPEKSSGIIWSYKITEEKRWCVIAVTAVLEQMQIPFQIKVEPLKQEKTEPIETVLQLSICSDDKISFFAYPPEYRAADAVFVMMDKLELINDMSVYEKLYDILRHEALDGRKLQFWISKKCKKHGLAVTEQRLTMLLGYRDYAYMKKKWRSYLKRENKKEPEWEKVMERLEQFIAPVWNMMCRDLIFIGDWMPELGRFLE